MLLLALVAQQTAAAVFEASLHAHEALSRYSAVVKVLGHTPAQDERPTIGIVVDGQDVLLHVQEPAKPGLAASDRSFLIRGKTLTALDAGANEWLTRGDLAGSNRADRLTSAVGTLEESAGVLLDHERMKSFYDRISGLPGWHVQRVGSQLKLTRSQPAQGIAMSVDFGATDHLLKALRMTSPGNELDWTIAYGPARAARLRIPASASKVASFTAREQAPKFKTTAAQAAYQRLSSATTRFRTGSIVATGAGPDVKVEFDGRRIHQKMIDLDWAYDGHTLSVVDGRHHSFSKGAMSRLDALEVLHQLGVVVDPIARGLLTGQPPFHGVFGEGAMLSIGGQVQVGSTHQTILVGESPGRRVSLLMSETTHLPTSVQTTFFDKANKPLVGEVRTFRYGSIGGSKPVSAFELAPPKGFKSTTLTPPKRLK